MIPKKITDYNKTSDSIHEDEKIDLLKGLIKKFEAIVF